MDLCMYVPLTRVCISETRKLTMWPSANIYCKSSSCAYEHQLGNWLLPAGDIFLPSTTFIPSVLWHALIQNPQSSYVWVGASLIPLILAPWLLHLPLAQILVHSPAGEGSLLSILQACDLCPIHICTCLHPQPFCGTDMD